MPGESTSSNTRFNGNFRYSSIPLYLKAFLLTCIGTTAYMLLRGTRLEWDIPNVSGIVVTDTFTVKLADIPTSTEPPNFFFVDLTPPETFSLLSTTVADEEESNVSAPINSMPVVVINPIPNQIIKIGETYTCDISQIFSGDYLRIQAIDLPNWLSLEHKKLSSYPVGSGYAQNIAISNNVVFVANREGGLQILNVSDPTHPLLLNTYLVENGSVLDIALLNNIAFIAADTTGWQILNVSNPLNPKLLRTIPSDGDRVMSIAVIENTLFVANFNKGLLIFNVSDLTHPEILSTYRTGNSSTRSITVSDNTAFIANEEAGLSILNVSNLTHPELLTIYSANGGYTYDVTVLGKTAFVANYNTGLFILNVSNLTNLTLLSIHKAESGFTFGVAISDNIAFVANHNAGLWILDVSNLRLPKLLGIYSLEGNNAENVVTSNNMVFVAYGEAGLQIPDFRSATLSGILPVNTKVGQKWMIDIVACSIDSALASNQFYLTADDLPKLVETTLTDQSIFPGDTLALSIKSEQLFTAPSTSFLRFSLHQVKNEALPTWLALSTSPILLDTIPSDSNGKAFSVVISDKKAFVANYDGGLQILDVSDPMHTKLLNTYPASGGKAYGVAVSGSTVFLANYNAGLLILDASNLTHLKSLSTYPVKNAFAWSVAVSGDTVFMANAGAGLQIFNVSNLTSPQLLSTYSTGGRKAYDVAVSGNTVFVANEDVGLQILNVSNLTHPELLSTYKANTGVAIGVAVLNSTVFLANWDGGLLILNVSELTHPQLLSTYTTNNDFARRVIVSKNIVFLANGPSGLQILDVSDLMSPRLLSTYVISNGRAYDVAVLNNTVFVANHNAGLHILNTSAWQLKISANPTRKSTGNYYVALTAADEIGVSVSIPFIIRVEGPPKLHSPITRQYVETGQLFSFNIPSDTFTDPNLDPLTLKLTPLNQTGLPTWLKFNEISATLFGTPTIQDRNILSLRLTAKDLLGQTAYTDFNLTVVYAPKPIPRQPISLVQSRFFNCTIGLGTIFDSYGQPLSYGLAPNDGKILPEWLSFTISDTTLTLSGTPTSTTVGVLTLLVLAKTDLGYSTNAPLVLSINHNFPPQVKKAISAQTATVGEWFDFVVNSKEVFEDQNNDPLTYTASLSNGEPLPDWLQFIQDQPDKKDSWHFKGKPGGWDTNPFSFRMMTIQITACDTDNHSAIALFNLTVNGTSTLGLLLKVATPLLSAFGLFQKRASVLNRLCYKRREKPSVRIAAERDFSLSLSTPRNEIGTIEVKTRHSRPKGCKRFTDCQRFFKPPIHYLQLPYDSLPTGPLPPWMRYEESKHTLEGTLPADTTYRELMICVKDHNGIIQEHFIFNVDAVTAIPGKNESFIPSHSINRQKKAEQTDNFLELNNLEKNSHYSRLPG